MICDGCGKHFTYGDTNGLPNGVGFQLTNYKTIFLCQECLIKLGSLTEEEKQRFIENLKPSH